MQSSNEPPPEPSSAIDQLTGAIIGAAIEVHRALGPVFLESVYEEALTHELELRSIPFERQLPIGIEYKGKTLGTGRLDLLVGGQVVVELKATERLLQIHRAQVLSYLRAVDLQVGLLINFNVVILRDGLTRVIWHGPYPD